MAVLALAHLGKTAPAPVAGIFTPRFKFAVVKRDGGVRRAAGNRFKLHPGGHPGDGDRPQQRPRIGVLRMLKDLPVSYTHLDVYKRQVWAGPSLPEAGWGGEMPPIEQVFEDYYVRENLACGGRGVILSGYGGYTGSIGVSAAEQDRSCLLYTSRCV